MNSDVNFDNTDGQIPPPVVNKKKRMTIVILLLLIVFGAIFGFNILRSVLIARFVAHYTPPPSSVSTIKAAARAWRPWYHSTGSMAAINGVTVSPEVAGIVVAIRFQSGQMVQQGQSLVQLDDSIDVEKLNNGQAQLNLKQLDFARQQKLYRSSAVAKSDYDQALADLQKAQADVNQALVSISQKNVRAPFSGKAGIRQVNLGQYLHAGDPVVTVQSLDPLYVNFSLPEQYLPNVHLGQALSVEVGAYPKAEFSGTVTAIDSQVAQDTRNITVQGTIPNPDLHLYPGDFAAVKVYLPEQASVITVPQTAVTYSLYGNIVYVVKPEGVDKAGKPLLRVHQQFVTVGQSLGDQVAILSGLSIGDEVVTSGQLKLSNGLQVVINNDTPLTLPKTSQLDGAQ